MIPDEFKKIEFAKTYDLLKSYGRVYFAVLITYIIVYPAIWAAYFILRGGQSASMADYFPAIGIILGIMFIFLLIHIRLYFCLMLRRLEFLKHFFLFTNMEFWQDYPLSYRRAGNKIEYPAIYANILSLKGLSITALTIISLGNTFLFYQMDLARYGVGDGLKLVLSMVLFVLHLILIALYSLSLNSNLEKNFTDEDTA
nr:hypothetical protein [candidate division Zixibacteria bacterium]